MESDFLGQIFEKFRTHISKALSRAKDAKTLKAVCRNASIEMDKTFAELVEQSGSKIACCAGCFYCCHIKVDVVPADAFLIADYIRSNFSKEKQASLLQAARENWAKIQKMTYHQQFISNMPCPLLENGRCTIYPVRPMLCRLHHSTHVEPCKNAYEVPELLTGPDTFIPPVRQTTSWAYMGIKTAFDEKFYDTNAYDINAALIECLTNSHAEKRWREKKTAFPKNMLAKEPPQAEQAA